MYTNYDVCRIWLLYTQLFKTFHFFFLFQRIVMRKSRKTKLERYYKFGI